MPVATKARNVELARLALEESAPDLLKVEDVAPIIGVHRDTLYRLCREGKFPPAVQIGRGWRISRPRLVRFLHGDAA